MTLPPTPLLQLVPPRAQRALDRVNRLIWREVAPVAVFHAEATAGHCSLAEALKLPLQKAEASFRWGKFFDQKWFKIVLPAPAREGDYLKWPQQGEATLYHEGAPYYGFDLVHQHCPLPLGATEFWLDAMCAETGMWAPGLGAAISAEGCKFSGGSIVRRDDQAWHAYHDLWFLFELAREEHRACFPPDAPFPGGFGYLPPLDCVSVLYRRLLRFMDEAVDALDTGGAAAMGAVLRKAYAELPANAVNIDYVATGHAHIDLVWLWTEKAGEAKAVHTFATMNRLMHVYPEFQFGYSQPASYAAVARRSPAMLERVKARIAEGRWEATGAAEVESDTNLSCGESLARSLIVGQRRFTELRGEQARTLWLPDVFGYCAALPQILAQTGVASFFTTKLTWGTVNKFPYSSFVWRGPDGSEVLAYVSQDYGYNGSATPAEMRKSAVAHRQSDVHPELLAPTGFGDGGGGVTEAMCERMRRAANLAGVPRARWGRIEDFFARLEARRARLPVYQGELYLEYHRGVNTSIGRVKAAHRACERALQTWEAARAARGGGEIDQTVWQRVIFTQFHDYIPGSSRQEVYDEGVPELQALAADALASASGELSAAAGAEAVFNPLPYERVVRAGGAVRRIGPLAGAPVAALPVVAEPLALVAEPGRLANGRVIAEFDAAGRVVALSVDGRALALAGPAGELVVFPDHPHQFDAWDIDRGTLALGRAAPAEAELVETGVVEDEAFAVFRRKLTERSSVEIRYALEAQGCVLRITYDLDWQDEETLLKVVFPTAYNGRFARYGAPFGSVLRSQQPGNEYDEAQWEVPASRWAAVMDEGDAEGLAVITEAKYGFSCRSGVLGLSLVRSPEYPCAGEPASLRRAEGLVRFSDLGRHVIRIALGLHAAERVREEQAAALADLLFTPVVAYAGGASDAGFLGLEGGESLQPCWAKPALDGKGWVLRLHETLGRRGGARLRLAPGWRASATDLGEARGAAVEEIMFTPYQLLSLRIERSEA